MQISVACFYVPIASFTVKNICFISIADKLCHWVVEIIFFVSQICRTLNVGVSGNEINFKIPTDIFIFLLVLLYDVLHLSIPVADLGKFELGVPNIECLIFYNYIPPGFLLNKKSIVSGQGYTYLLWFLLFSHIPLRSERYLASFIHSYNNKMVCRFQLNRVKNKVSFGHYVLCVHIHVLSVSVERIEIKKKYFAEILTILRRNAKHNHPFVCLPVSL